MESGRLVRFHHWVNRVDAGHRRLSDCEPSTRRRDGSHQLLSRYERYRLDLVDTSKSARPVSFAHGNPGCYRRSNASCVDFGCLLEFPDRACANELAVFSDLERCCRTAGSGVYGLVLRHGASSTDRNRRQ